MIYKDNNISLIRANNNSQLFDSGDIGFSNSYPYSNLFYPFLLDNGGNYRNVSLTIDVLSKEYPENKFPNEKWISENRLRNNLLQDNIKWGFKETNNIAKDSRAISNAFCFADQKLSFYIQTQGDDSGYVGDIWCYCRTTLVVTVLDILTGTQTQLSSFSNFSSEGTETTRYFEWTVPAMNDEAFTSYGLFGMFVIKLDITRAIYKDAKLTVPLETDCPNKSQSLLQLLTYSAAKELMYVNADSIPIITGPINEHSSYVDIFNNSVFAALESLNDNALTNDQRRSIITDQAAVLFMSQHPVVVADCYPSKIIGFGVNEAVRPQYIFDSFLSNKNIRTLQTLSADRLYGMIATYRAFNYIDDIQSNFSNFNQSQQIIRDPARSVMVDENGILNQDYGVNGIQFNPYVLELNNAEIILESGNTSSYTFTLSPNLIEASNVMLTAQDGRLLTIDEQFYYLANGKMKLSFDVLDGEENIKRIRYVIWSKNNLEGYEYVDSNVYSRSHIFTARNSTTAPYPYLGISYSNTSADVVFARIDIEDVSNGVSSFYYEKFLPEPTFATNVKAGVTSISVLQRQDGSELVDIYYDYFTRSTINASNVYAYYSLTGTTYTLLGSNDIRGDVGLGILPGRNRIIWKPSLTLSNTVTYPTTAYIKLTTGDADGNTNIGVNNSIGIVTLSKPDVVIRRLSQEEEEE